ncbi:MAG: hypothetical protein AAFU80_17490 [Pseudomonadota bacterium]
MAALAVALTCTTGSGALLAGALPVEGVGQTGPIFVPPGNLPPASAGTVAGATDAATGNGSGGGGAAAGGAGGEAIGETFDADELAAAAAAEERAAEAARQARAALESALAICGSLPKAYVVSCVGERLGVAAAALPSDAEFAAPKAALAQASRSLEQVARANRDRSAPRITARTSGPSPIQTERPLTPVAPERVEAVLEEAEDILDEVETVLLRSAEASQQRAELFFDMAEAVESNKVLLRS